MIDHPYLQDLRRDKYEAFQYARHFFATAMYKAIEQRKEIVEDAKGMLDIAQRYEMMIQDCERNGIPQKWKDYYARQARIDSIKC